MAVKNAQLFVSKKACMRQGIRWGADRDLPFFDIDNDITLKERYEEIRTIGKGGFGKVTLVRDVDGGMYAVKSIEIGTNKPIATNLLRELDPRNFDHPNIIGYCRCGIHAVPDDGTVFLDLFMDPADKDGVAYVREFMEKNKKIVKTASNSPAPFSDDKIIAAVQMANAIAHLHTFLIVHGDIKLDNFLFDGVEFGITVDDKEIVPHVMLADFGLSTVFAPWYTTTRRVGTRTYIAPEVLLGSVFRTWQMDIWSLACTLFVFLTNDSMVPTHLKTFDEDIEYIFKLFGTPSERTYNGVTQLEHWKKMASALPVYKGNTTALQYKLTNYPGVWDILKRMLSINPNERPLATTVAGVLGEMYLPKYGKKAREIVETCIPSSYTNPILKQGSGWQFITKEFAISSLRNFISKQYVPIYNTTTPENEDIRAVYRRVSENILLSRKLLKTQSGITTSLRTLMRSIKILQQLITRNKKIPFDRKEFDNESFALMCATIAAGILSITIKHDDGALMNAISDNEVDFNAYISNKFSLDESFVILAERRILFSIDMDIARPDPYVFMSIIKPESVETNVFDMACVLALQVLSDPDASAGLDDADISYQCMSAATISSKIVIRYTDGREVQLSPRLKEFFVKDTERFLNKHQEKLFVEHKDAEAIIDAVRLLVTLHTTTSTTKEKEAVTVVDTSHMFPNEKTEHPRDTRTIPLQPDSSIFLVGYNELLKKAVQTVTTGMLYKLRIDLGKRQFSEWYKSTLIKKNNAYFTEEKYAAFEKWFAHHYFDDQSEMLEPYTGEKHAPVFHSGWIVDIPGIDPTLGERYYQTLFCDKKRCTAKDVVALYYDAVGGKDAIRSKLEKVLKTTPPSNDIDLDAIANFVFNAGRKGA